MSSSSPLSNPQFANYILSRTSCPVLVFQTPSKRKRQLQLQSYPTAPKVTTKLTSMAFATPPPPVKDSIITFPTPQILQVKLNRPKDLNCINTQGHYELDALYRWYDAEPSLRCAILTGEGRAFCAGADLKEWHNSNNATPAQQPQDTSTPSPSPQERTMPPSGFGALSRRGGKKPIICAVNGICLGGGCEMIINADIVIAESHAVFGLPEASIGVVAVAGALPRLVRTVGRPRAMEMALTGRKVSAEEAREWGLVNRVVGKGEGVREALSVAALVVGNSPDSVIVSREGIKMGWEGVGAEEGTRLITENWYSRMDKGENMKEGVRSFVEKRKPVWVPSKL